MTVLIFPSQIEGEPLERHETFAAQTVVSFDGLLPLPDEYVEDVSAADEAA